MNVPTISMEKEAAQQELANYQSLVKERRTEEDEAIMRAYREVVKGRQILNLADAMREAGVREDGYPMLAICRADELVCEVDMRPSGGATFAGYKDEPQWYRHRSLLRRVRVPDETFPRRTGWIANARTMVPTVPPHLRPKAHLRNYHVLWEVEEWKVVPPRDPMLLKRLGGQLFAVLAVWDLTDVERAVLAGRTTT